MTNTSDRRGGPGRRTILALVAALVGVVLIAVAVRAQQSAPQPPRSAGHLQSSSSSSGRSTPGSTGSPKADYTAEGPSSTPLGPSKPRRIDIPSIGVHSDVFPIGKNPDGTLAVPQPGPRLDKTAWFKNSPTPGQPGPSVIEGHVDSEQGSSVFFKLGDIRPGDLVKITRADGVRAVFKVDALRDYHKSRFPTKVVYGAQRGGRPELRLITCSDFDSSIHHHVGNLVVFTHLVRHHH